MKVRIRFSTRVYYEEVVSMNPDAFAAYTARLDAGDPTVNEEVIERYCEDGGCEVDSTAYEVESIEPHP